MIIFIDKKEIKLYDHISSIKDRDLSIFVAVSPIIRTMPDMHLALSKSLLNE